MLDEVWGDALRGRENGGRAIGRLNRTLVNCQGRNREKKHQIRRDGEKKKLSLWLCLGSVKKALVALDGGE